MCFKERTTGAFSDVLYGHQVKACYQNDHSKRLAHLRPPLSQERLGVSMDRYVLYGGGQGSGRNE